MIHLLAFSCIIITSILLDSLSHHLITPPALFLAYYTTPYSFSSVVQLTSSEKNLYQLYPQPLHQ